MRLFSDVASQVEDPYLARAVTLAERASGRTWPNPTVGCVIVNDDRIIGEGYHPRAGMPHAEVFALADAGAGARGAAAYVTLEPCAHHGKTPPCAEALIAAGVARVVIGMRDPNPEASGGAERLRGAGISVDFAAEPSPFAALNAGWLKLLATGMPLVIVKSGLSLDARVSFAQGERTSLTGPSGAEVTNLLRSRVDAVLVSAATVTADDPALTVRDVHGTAAEHQPLRVVLCRTAVPTSDVRVFTDSAAPTLVLASDIADESALARLPRDIRIARWRASDGVAAALRVLGEHGVGDVLVEPGPRLLTALWQASAIDEYVTVTAGGMIGGDAQLFLGEPDRDDDSLLRRMKPLEAGIVGDVSATVWGAHERPDEE